MGLLKEEFREKVSRFFRYNWHLMTLGWFLTTVITIGAWINMATWQAQTDKRLVELATYSTFTTADGRVFKVEKVPIETTSDIYSRYLENLGKRFIFDGSILTKGFKQQIEKPEDFMAVKYFSSMIEDFADSEETADVIRKFYFKKFTDDELPEVISIISSKVVDYNGNIDHLEDAAGSAVVRNWSISIDYKVHYSYWLKEKNNIFERNDHILLEIIGISDPAKYSTISNPYGVKVHFRVKFPGKREDG